MPKLLLETNPSVKNRVYALDADDFTFHYKPSEFIKDYEYVSKVSEVYCEVYIDGSWTPIYKNSLRVIIKVEY